MNAEEVLKRVDKNTIGVTSTFGVTFTCQHGPVKKVSDALDELQRKTGLNIPIHVDGTSGGFLAPFCVPNIEWDFSIPRVKSINSSGHKFGLAPLGAGWIVWREKKDLPEELIFNVNYLGGNMPTFALNFSRPGGKIIAQYYNFLRLGREGYTLYDLADRLRSRGWQVPVYSMLAKREDLVVQRILVRHGVSRDLANLLIDDMKRALDYFKKHPVTVPFVSN